MDTAHKFKNLSFKEISGVELSFTPTENPLMIFEEKLEHMLLKSFILPSYRSKLFVPLTHSHWVINEAAIKKVALNNNNLVRKNIDSVINNIFIKLKSLWWKIHAWIFSVLWEKLMTLIWGSLISVKTLPWTEQKQSINFKNSQQEQNRPWTFHLNNL